MTARTRSTLLQSLAATAWIAASLVPCAGCDAEATAPPDPAERSRPPAEVAEANEPIPQPMPQPMAMAETEPETIAASPSPAAADAGAPSTGGDAPQDAVATAPAPPKETIEDRSTRIFGKLLAEVITDEGLVRYDLLKEADRALRLATVIDGYARAGRPADRSERLALWCNAYNANVLAGILMERRNPGFENVIGVKGFFERPITVAGESISLNDLENKRIRPEGDARIHAALVCAAVSCPPLRKEAYTAERLDKQLDDQCRRWVQDKTKFRIENGALGLSQILKWYGEDFNSPPFGNPQGFVLAYADPSGALARMIVNEDAPRITWLKYDWTLNDAPKRKDAGGS